MSNPTGIGLKPIQKGERRGGRQPGQPNYITKDLKDEILLAAQEVGFVRRVEKLDKDGKPTGQFDLVWSGEEGRKGYLKWLAVYHPAIYGPMFARLVPHELNQRIDNRNLTINADVRYRTFAEVEAELKKGGFSDEKIQFMIEDLRK